jgi:hypothetical protein
MRTEIVITASIKPLLSGSRSAVSRQAFKVSICFSAGSFSIMTSGSFAGLQLQAQNADQKMKEKTKSQNRNRQSSCRPQLLSWRLD